MIGQDIHKAAQLLRAGELVGIPTETVYGLAANALDTSAVAEIFLVKNRPVFDPLIVHFADFFAAKSYLQSVPAMADVLAMHFMPGPLTLLLPKSERIPDLVTAGSAMVAIRVPRHPMTQALLHLLDFPLAAPSANPFGYISPTTAAHVESQLGERIPYILDGGPCLVGLESSIVGFPEGQPTVYRKGGISVEAIEALIGSVEVKPFSTSNPESPGMLKSHYAPGVPLILGDLNELQKRFAGKKIGVLAFRQYVPNIPTECQVVLSPQGDFAEAARRLFWAMRYLDEQRFDLIIAELLPEKDLGRAINDRLRRAAAK